MAYTTMDVPQENYLVTIILPFMLSIVVVVIIIMVMNRSAGGGGANARMMNFGKSRARMSRDSKVNFSNVAGLVEEKEELEEVVDFLKNPQKYTNVGARIPKGLLLVGPPERVRPCLPRQWPARQEFRFSPSQVLISWRCSWAWALHVSGICSRRPRRTLLYRVYR